MTSRDRTRSITNSSAGAAVWHGPGVISGNYASTVRTERCIDVIDGTRRPHELIIQKSTQLIYRVYGRSTSGPNYWDYRGYNVTGPHFNSPALTAEPSNSSSLLSALARTNPNRVYIDAPVFVYELKDLPEMIYSKGLLLLSRQTDGTKIVSHGYRDLSHIPKAVGQKYLEWQFGWGPLLSDLSKLFQFQAVVEKKFRRYRNLLDRGSVGGYSVVWEDTGKHPESTRFLTPLYQESNIIRFTGETTRRKWATTIWKPSVKIPPIPDADLWNVARRATFGLDVTPATLWEIMPWSWLIDWFSNVGELMTLSRNTIPVDHSGSCVMRQTESRFVFVNHVSGPGTYQVSISPIPQFVDKRRDVMGNVTPMAEFNIPFLNGRQLGILGSLSVTRRVPIS